MSFLSLIQQRQSSEGNLKGKNAPSTLILYHHISYTSSGYWYQRADERHGNPPPR